MTYLYLAFFMGLFGSIHCAVMCGPLLLAIHGQATLSWKLVANRLLYQFGRILTYGILGAVLGIFGNLASLQGGQRSLSLSIGILLLLIGLIQLFGKKNQTLIKFQTKALQPLIQYMGKYLYRPGGSFIAGMLNGLLPCGMVYMALAAALNANSMLNAAMFMVLFGLGTLPLLFLYTFISQVSHPLFKQKFQRMLPYLYVLMGIWFILRGANLNIAYLSPLLQVDGAMNCS